MVKIRKSATESFMDAPTPDKRLERRPKDGAPAQVAGHYRGVMAETKG